MMNLRLDRRVNSDLSLNQRVEQRTARIKPTWFYSTSGSNVVGYSFRMLTVLSLLQLDIFQLS